MLNEKQANVLTEETLNLIEKNNFGSTFSEARGNIIALIASHRTLNSRNASLVHENDELMAENEKLKRILEGLNHE